MNHVFEPTDGFPDDCIECCEKEAAHQLINTPQHTEEDEEMLWGETK